jgi:hypothetical protein
MFFMGGFLSVTAGPIVHQGLQLIQLRLGRGAAQRDVFFRVMKDRKSVV